MGQIRKKKRRLIGNVLKIKRDPDVQYSKRDKQLKAGRTSQKCHHERRSCKS